jgi:hypothetical protein
MSWAFWDSSTPYLIGAVVSLAIGLWRLILVERLRTWMIWFDSEGKQILSVGTTFLLISLLFLVIGLWPNT